MNKKDDELKEDELLFYSIYSMLTRYYEAGAKQSKTSKVSDDKEVKEREKFRKLIDKEAKKRNIKPYELIEYFVPRKKELVELYRSGIDSIIFKKSLPKFSKIYIHKELENMFHRVFVGERLRNKGLQTVNIPTIGEESMIGEFMVWENKGIEYFVKADDILKFNSKNPKVFASQIKNISLLMGMTQEQQYNNSIKEAKCEFTFTYYAERRGYSKEEVSKGGNFFNELKRDLLTGAYTTYRIDKVIIEGKEYIAHGIPNFYTLYEPKDHETKWKVDFNNPYSGWIIKILNGEAGQYFVTNPKAIEDRVTTEKPYLFLFYMQLIKRKRANLFTTPVKIGNLLKDMKIDEQLLARPKECFKLLKECLIYFSQNYQPVPEIDQFFLYNDFHKTKTIKLPLNISEAFKQYPYEDIKNFLKGWGTKDIREAYISFKRPYEKPKRKHKLSGPENELLDRTIAWFNGQITKIPSRDQKKILTMYIKKLGYDHYKYLFEKEANKTHANAVEFLTKILKENLHTHEQQNK